MYTVTKTYNNLKAAHRQWRHPGHCKGIHGENWTFHVTFGCSVLDHCNFVVDFAGLRGLRDVLEDKFDHTLLIDDNDPAREYFEDMHDRGYAKVVFVPSACSEGLANYVFKLAMQFVNKLNTMAGDARLHVVKVVVEEDCKNTATFEPSYRQGVPK